MPDMVSTSLVARLYSSSYMQIHQK